MTHRLLVSPLPAYGDLPMPRYETAGAAGLDLRACLTAGGPFEIEPGARAMIHTGLRVAIPPGFEGQIRPRSGLAWRTGYQVHPGTIDSDYRGEICVIVTAGPDGLTIDHGDRIAQLVISPVIQPEIVRVDSLDNTERGAGGFGSTGGR